MTSVEALLRLPTDEIKSSLPTVTDEDASLVLREMETVLRKCLYAVRYTLTAPFSVFLHILSQPVISESTNIAEVLLAPVEEGRCLDLVVDVCSTLLRPEHHAFRGSVNVEGFFEMIQQLCASAALKDSFGAVIMPCLLTFLSFAVEKEDDYRQARACASLLITLIRGSKANKNRMSVECGHIGGALTKSSDIFFQMQCVEILFRLYTHNRTVLATSTLPEFFKKGVAELPNDANLLTSIQTLLDAYNMEHRTFDLIQFTALLIEAGKEEVCGHTALYFSPLILVIMIPGYSGDNITIPYEHIRSVKLSKERKLALRLHVIPVRLSHAMNTAEGKDTLMISLTQSTFSAIRSSGVHEWIAERKRRVPASRLRQQMEILSASSSLSSVRAEMLSSQNRHLKDAEYVEGENEHFVRASAANQATKTAPSLNHGVSIEEEKKTKKPKVSSKPTSPNRKSQPIPKQQQKEEEEAAGEVEGNALRQLHEAASFKVERMRQDNQGKLQCAVDFMQEEIEKMRRLNARERDDFEASVREDLTSVRRAEVQVKARATECIQSLNQELKEIQALSEVLRSEVKNVRENLRTVLQDTESLEEESLVQLKAMVDEDMKSMEETLVHLMSSTNPLSFLAKYLSRKLDTTEHLAQDIYLTSSSQMAKDTAKKNMRKNASRMRLFTLFTWVVNVCALLSVLYHRGSFPWPRDLLGLAFFTLQEAAALALLRQFAAPTLGPAGELLDCPDVSNPAELGVYSWAQDVLWVCWAAQGLGFLVHWTGALLYLPVPVLAAGKLWALAAPMLKNRGEAVVAAESGPVQHTRAERRKQEILLRKKGTR